MYKWTPTARRKMTMRAKKMTAWTSMEMPLVWKFPNSITLLFPDNWNISPGDKRMNSTALLRSTLAPNQTFLSSLYSITLLIITNSKLISMVIVCITIYIWMRDLQRMITEKDIYIYISDEKPHMWSHQSLVHHLHVYYLICCFYFNFIGLFPFQQFVFFFCIACTCLLLHLYDSFSSFYWGMKMLECVLGKVD